MTLKKSKKVSRTTTQSFEMKLKAAIQRQILISLQTMSLIHLLIRMMMDLTLTLLVGTSLIEKLLRQIGNTQRRSMLTLVVSRSQKEDNNSS